MGNTIKCFLDSTANSVNVWPFVVANETLLEPFDHMCQIGMQRRAMHDFIQVKLGDLLKVKLQDSVLTSHSLSDCLSKQEVLT